MLETEINYTCDCLLYPAQPVLLLVSWTLNKLLASSEETNKYFRYSFTEEINTFNRVNISHSIFFN